MSHNHPEIIDNLSVDETSRNFYQNVMQTQMTRREVMAGVTAATAVAAGGSLLASCTGDGLMEAPTPAVTSIAKSLADRVVIPAGYTATVLYSLGDPVKAGIPAYKNDGTDTDFANRAGDHFDALYFFGMNAAGTFQADNSARGLLCMNHEALTEAFLHAGKIDNTRTNGNRRVSSQVLKEIEAHGISVIEVTRGVTGNGVTQVLDSAKNRRLTARTPMTFSGPAAGDARLKHKSYTANGATFGDGISTQGTLNNCANGYTPWGTYLTCEENWAGYFFRGKADQTRRDDIERYGIRTINAAGAAVDSVGFQGHNWDTADGNEEEFKRFDCTATGADGSADYRNVPNNFGYIVEVDPFNPASVIKKRTALGRMGHEGCWPGKITAGKPVTFYMGDDGRFEYIYKFVSSANWDPADVGGGVAAGDKYMNSGKLYAAKFDSSGNGTWLELAPGQNGLSSANGFGTQADVAIVTRRAADIAGATNMDRPEWATVNQANGDVFFTLTNNSGRGNGAATELPEIYKGGQDIGVDAANPRVNNGNGHIIRIREAGGDNSATNFRWEILVFGARADNAANNISQLTSVSDFSSPDGLWMDPRGLLWIQTDDGSTFTTGTGAAGSGSEALSNNQMLVTIPGEFGQVPVIRRFLVGPKGCELTGVDMTPDGKTMFVNIQHPGEVVTNLDLTKPATFQSHWPMGSNPLADAASGTARPRSSTIVITKDDGGIIGL
ncbi:MAG: PhoX family phosphatase [Stagnimonas sp.]|nr:PhoX family phosphatase [Stagnimonas sp.]